MNHHLFESVCKRIKSNITKEKLHQCKEKKKIIYIDDTIIKKLIYHDGHILIELCNNGYIDGNFKNTIEDKFYSCYNLLIFIKILLDNRVSVDGNFFLDNISYPKYHNIDIDIDKKSWIEIFCLLNDHHLIQNYDFIYCSYFCVDVLEIIEKNIVVDYIKLFGPTFRSGYDKFIDQHNYCLNKLYDLSDVNLDDIIINTIAIKYDSINILIEKRLNIHTIDCRKPLLDVDTFVNIVNVMQNNHISMIDKIYLTNEQFAIFLLKVNTDKLDLLLSDNKFIVCDCNYKQQFEELKSDREKLFEKYNINTYAMLTSLALCHGHELKNV